MSFWVIGSVGFGKCLMTHIHRFSTLKIPCASPCHSSLPPNPKFFRTKDIFMAPNHVFSKISSIWNLMLPCQIGFFHLPMYFWDSFMCFMAWYLISFFLWAISHLIVVMTLTVYPFGSWSTSCLTLLSIMNKAPTDIRVRLLCVLKVSANLCLYQGAGLLDLPICMSMLRIHGKFLSSNVGIPISFPPPRNEDYQQLLIFTSVLCFEFI